MVELMPLVVATVQIGLRIIERDKGKEHQRTVSHVAAASRAGAATPASPVLSKACVPG